jgi:hypothetical protein
LGLALGTLSVLNRLLSLLLLLAVCCAWAATDWLAPLAEQTDPDKLAALGKRGANPRINRIVFYLHQAQQTGTAPAAAMDRAFQQNGTTGLVAVLSKETQLLNYQHAQDWGLLTPENLADLKTGKAPRITRGPHAGQDTDVDHIVPVSLAPEAGNSLANLELLPSSVNRAKGARVGWREVQFAACLQEAGIIQESTLTRVRWKFFCRNILPWLGAAMAVGLLWFARRSRNSALRGLLGLLVTALLRGQRQRRR